MNFKEQIKRLDGLKYCMGGSVYNEATLLRLEILAAIHDKLADIEHAIVSVGDEAAERARNP